MLGTQTEKFCQQICVMHILVIILGVSSFVRSLYSLSTCCAESRSSSARLSFLPNILMYFYLQVLAPYDCTALTSILCPSRCIYVDNSTG
ncbi:hypothetical protein C8R48DRAFT_694017 [Suillus tomentosus]|nr:hypothetical protein C8R48DRAFT_694017 [Suillus tomentosus]